MRTKNLILALLITAVVIPVFAVGVQNKDPYINGQVVMKADPYMDGARKADVYTDGTVYEADPYTDGALCKVDPYTDGALVGKADPFAGGQ